MVALPSIIALTSERASNRFLSRLGTRGMDIVAECLAGMLDRAAMLGWPRVPNLGFGTDKRGPLPFQLGTDEGGPVAVPFQLTYRMDIVET